MTDNVVVEVDENDKKTQAQATNKNAIVNIKDILERQEKIRVSTQKFLDKESLKKDLTNQIEKTNAKINKLNKEYSRKVSILMDNLEKTTEKLLKIDM